MRQSQDDTPYVVDPEEYALLEKLEKNARKVDNDKETTIHRNTENLIRSVSIRNLGSDYESLGKQVLQEQRVVEQKDYSGSFETIDEDLLVFALDSVEQQYLSSNRTENSKQLVTNSVNQPSWQVYSNQRQFVSCSKTSFETNSNENELEKPDSLCETGVRPQKQSIERYLPTISPSSNNIASSNSCAELTSPKIRNFQTTLDSVTDCLWFPSKSSKKLSQNVSLDIDAARSWIFPTNIPERAYQFNIVRSALACNTLVCLPTGLGKTFIAAVVMYNFLRWYPEGKVSELLVSIFFQKLVCRLFLWHLRNLWFDSR